MKRKSPSRTRGGNPAHLAPIRWSYDKLGTHFSPRKQPQPPPTVGILSPPASCDIRINEQWIAHIIGALEALTQIDAWSERSEWAINQIEILMAAITARIVDSYDCGGDMPFQIRQKPGAPCVLQQSLDGGLNWSDAFDFSECLSVAVRPLIVHAQSQSMATATAELHQIMQTYINSGGGGQPTIDQIAPAFTRKPEHEKDMVLCEACRTVVDMLCELELERRKNVIQGAQAAAAVLFSVGIVVATALSAGAFAIAAAAALGVMIDAGLTGINMVSDTILNDKNARKDVACCMYNALKGQSPTLNNFGASLTNCAFDPVSSAAQMAGAIAPLLGHKDIHASFLNSLNDLSRWAELELISCPCLVSGQVIVPWDSPMWTTRGEYSRSRASTPVGQFDSFFLSDTATITLPSRANISRIAVNQNVGSAGGWLSVEIFVDGTSVGIYTSQSNTLGCEGWPATWEALLSPPIRGRTITIKGVNLMAGSYGPYSHIYCAVLTLS